MTPRADATLARFASTANGETTCSRISPSVQRVVTVPPFPGFCVPPRFFLTFLTVYLLTAISLAEARLRCCSRCHTGTHQLSVFEMCIFYFYFFKKKGGFEQRRDCCRSAVKFPRGCSAPLAASSACEPWSHFEWSSSTGATLLAD